VTSKPVSVAPGDLKLVGAGAIVLLFALLTATWTDSDLWGHTRFGLDILRDHALPSDDPYSFTQDKPWVNHEWLSELQMGIAYAVAGPAGLALLKGTLTFSALLLIWGALGGVDPTARIVIFALTAMSTAPIVIKLRPHVWSLLLLVILCRILIEDRRQARWGVPVLFALWANLHGGWIVGFGILAIWTIGDVVIRGRGDLKAPLASVAIAILSLLATLATPYGWRLWAFLVETVRLGREDITEWRPLWWHSPADSVPWALALATAVWLLTRPHRFRLHVGAVLAMLAFSAFRVARIGPLFVVCAALLLSPWFRERFSAFALRATADKPAPLQPGAAGGEQRLVAAGLLGAALIGAVLIGSKSLTCVRTVGDWAPDRDAAQVLEGAPPGRLVSYFNWGEFAIWHFGPRLRVSMDGRRETVYSDARLVEHDAIVRGTELGFTTLAGWQAEYVWLPSTSARTRAWLLANGYRLERETRRSFVVSRQDLPALPAVRGKSAEGAACFPD
jgi:hypothetical protein